MDEDFELELRRIFLDEADQIVAEAEKSFLELEARPDDSVVLERIFRLAHNLKGSAKAVGFDELGSLTHEIESFLLKLKNREIPVQSATVNLLLRCSDHIAKMIEALKKDPNSRLDGSTLTQEIQLQMAGPTPSIPSSAKNLVHQGESPTESQHVSGLDHVSDTTSHDVALTVPTAEPLDKDPFTWGVFSDQSPLLPQPDSKPRAGELAPTIKNSDPSASTTQVVTDESIRVSLNRVERLINLVGELVIYHSMLEQQTSSCSSTVKKTLHQLSKVTKEVQNISMSLRMVPLRQTFQKMQRIVRDTSAQLDKNVHLKIVGDETEVDKTVLESLSDPLVHLVRNAIDHGVESAILRAQLGKPALAQVTLSAYHKSGQLIIEVQDDGHGLDAEKLRQKAVEKNLILSTAHLSEKECYHLILKPGFSTKAVVTDISGRGVGMDVVKTNIEHLQGDIQIETELGKGTLFRVRLPLTLAIVDGVLVRSDNDIYVIPLSHMHESLRPRPQDVHFVSGMGEVLVVRGENMPLYRLASIVGRVKSTPSTIEGIAIIVRTLEKPFAVLVDSIESQQQVVIKQLGIEHRALKGFSGSAILGDGKPCLILELPELVATHGENVRVKQDTRRVAA